jgi:hypothetical protein
MSPQHEKFLFVQSRKFRFDLLRVQMTYQCRMTAAVELKVEIRSDR